MVASTEHGQPKKGENKEVEDAKAAQEAADPRIDDPRAMPNIIPQTGEGGKAKKAAVDSGQGPSPHNPINSPQAENPTVTTGEDEDE